MYETDRHYNYNLNLSKTPKNFANIYTRFCLKIFTNCCANFYQHLCQTKNLMLLLKEHRVFCVYFEEGTSQNNKALYKNKYYIYKEAFLINIIGKILDVIEDPEIGADGSFATSLGGRAILLQRDKI